MNTPTKIYLTALATYAGLVVIGTLDQIRKDKVTNKVCDDVLEEQRQWLDDLQTISNTLDGAIMNAKFWEQVLEES